MLFNFSKTIDFQPEFAFSNGEIWNVVEETKLLGVVINSNLKWHSNTLNIVKKAMSRMWLLRRMKHIKLDNSFIFDYYIKEIRPVAEFGLLCGIQASQQLKNLTSNAYKKLQ